MTKRELKELCLSHDNCAECAAHYDARIACAVRIGNHNVVPEDYPDSILDEEVDHI